MKTYTFRVAPRSMTGTWRDLELRADQTLEDLHLAIQDAFDFGNDHLYSFFMSNRAWDRRSEYCLPEGVGPWGDDDALFDIIGPDGGKADEKQANPMLPREPSPEDVEKLIEQGAKAFGMSLKDFREMLEDIGAMMDSMQAEEQARDVRTTTLDSLRLQKGKKFLYLFDYGDEWRFQVRVTAVGEKAAGGPYPRVVASVGEAPAQYPDWDEEDWDEEDEEHYDRDAEAEAIASQPLPVIEYPADGRLTPAVKKQIGQHCRSFMYRVFWPRLRSEAKDSGPSQEYAFFCRWHGQSCFLDHFPMVFVMAAAPKNPTLARIKYSGEGRFSLACMSEKRKWQETDANLTLDECFAVMERDERFWP